MVIGKGKEKANPLRCGKYWDSCTAQCTLNNIVKRMSPVSYSDTANYATQEQTRNQDLIDYFFDLKCNSFVMSQIFPLLCYEKNDILRYTDTDFDQPRFQATPVIFQSTFDYYLLSYCAMRYFLLKGKYRAISTLLNDYLTEERRKAKDRRRKYPPHLNIRFQPRYAGDLQAYQLPEFALNAAQDILCKTLFLRPNATEQLSSLQLHGHFISEKSLENKQCFVVQSADAAHFDLEDYFYYEYFTGVNLSLEITAALMEISDASPEIFDAEYIWDNVKENIKSLVQSPMLLSRNAVARYYILEIQNEFRDKQQRLPVGTEINGCKKYKPLLDSAINRAIKQVDIEAAKLFIPCKTESFHTLNRDKNLRERSPFESRQGSNEPVADVGDVYKPSPICNYISQDALAWENASEYFKANLMTILDPVNPSEFLKNPRYGPFVFCNIKHAGVKDILDMIDVNAKEFNICRDRSKPIRLFQRVHKEILDSIAKPPEALERCFMIPADGYGSSES